MMQYVLNGYTFEPFVQFEISRVAFYPRDVGWKLGSIINKQVQCHDALEALFEIRYWQKIWQTLESVTLTLARSGRTQDAAVILGHLDGHSAGTGLEHAMHFRE